MAVLYITELDSSPPAGQATGLASQPAVAEQTVAIGGASVASNAFNTKTKFVRLHTDAICSIEFGTAPVATAVTARMAANTTEYWAVPQNSAFKVAVITNT